jgi:septum formation protein
MRPLILASSSAIRADLLRRAGLDIEVMPARVDEDAVRDSLLAEGASARDMADALAELKADRIARKRPDDLVLGCDQILEFDGQALGKPDSSADARARLTALSGQTHRLFSAAVLHDRGRPVWRHVAEAQLTMRALSPEFLDWYLARVGDEAVHTVGAYAIEGVGLRLFERIEGDYFGILGLPLLELLAVLSRRGDIPA